MAGEPDALPERRGKEYMELRLVLSYVVDAEA
jgi:hypothetical protein